MRPLRHLMFTLALIPTIAAAAAPAGMQKVGEASLHKLFFHVYDATLYAPGGKFDPAKKYALELTYQMDFTSAEIIDRSIDEIRHAQPVSAGQEQQWRDALAKVIPDVKDGDRIRALATPGKSIVFAHNEKTTGTMTDKTLVEPFMNIWLGDKTNEPTLRKKLIAQ